MPAKKPAKQSLKNLAAELVKTWFDYTMRPENTTYGEEEFRACLGKLEKLDFTMSKFILHEEKKGFYVIRNAANGSPIIMDYMFEVVFFNLDFAKLVKEELAKDEIGEDETEILQKIC